MSKLDELRQQVRDLQERLGINASNSSLPPSANPPQAPKPVKKQKTGRPRAAALPGHRPARSRRHRHRVPRPRPRLPRLRGP